MLFLVYFCWNTVCNGIYVHPVSLHCMDLPSVISFIIKFTAQSSWVVLVGLVASSLLDVFFIFWFVNLIQLCKSWWTEGRVSGGCKEKKSENLSSAFAWLYIYLTLQTMNEKYTKHQSAFLILMSRFKFYLPFF